MAKNERVFAVTIETMRKNYCLAGLDIGDVDPDPLVQFDRWFHEARQSDLPDWMEVNAMTLATASSDGTVTSRIVLLKGVEEGRFVFYTNYGSVKGQHLQQNPRVSLCFFWPHLERQVLIDGVAAKVSRQRSEQYFHSRPRESQVGAWTSAQSSVVDGRDVLQQRYQQLTDQFNGDVVPLPDQWGGYEVTADRIEFWQGRPSRLHDRIQYRRDQDQWEIQRLSP